MPWVKFSRDYSFVPMRKRTISIAFKAGMTMLVTTECAAVAIFAGAAERVEKPRGQNDSGNR